MLTTTKIIHAAEQQTSIKTHLESAVAGGLASGRANYVTGQVWSVDGGSSLL